MIATLPWSDAAEQSLLGAVLLKPEIMGWLEVNPKSFHGAKNSAIWSAMTALHGREIAIDVVTIEAELSKIGTLEAIGGLSYISKVAIQVPTAANAESYAKTLEEFRVTREVLHVVAEVNGREGVAGEALLDALLGELAGIKRAKANEQTAVSDTLPNLAKAIIADVDSIAKGNLGDSFCPTGIDAVDFAVGGAPRGTVTVVGARPGGGKSATLLNMAEHAARLGMVAVIFTTEDPRDRWGERWIAKHGLIDLGRIYKRKLTPVELRSVLEVADYMDDLPNLHVVHAHGMTAVEISRIAIGFGAKFVGVDYIQKVKSPNRAITKLHEIIEANSKIFGDYAGKSGAAVVILSQMSKEIEKENRRPTKADLRYGDGLTQEAKLMILLHDPKNKDRPMLREMLIAKMNQGEKEMVIEVLFDGAHCRFLDASAMKSQQEF